MKILTLTGTRPEIIRMSETIKVLDEVFDNTFIHSGQNTGTNMKEIFFEDLELRKPDLEWEIDSSSLAAIIGSTMKHLELYIREFRPNVLVTLGDTNSALAGLIAKRYGVVTYHIEAGNRSFDENVPEEINRRIIDHFSDFNLAYSTNAYNNLIQEGLHPRKLMICGSPMLEIINKHRSKIENSPVLANLSLKKDSYFLLSAHRQENVDNPDRLRLLWNSLNELSINYKKSIVISLHPRTKSKIEQFRIKSGANLIFHDPFGFIDYMSLQANAFCVLSDSGTISEESAILKYPAITIRDSMERPEALDSGSIIMTGLEEKEIQRGVEIVRLFKERVSIPDAYAIPDHSLRVVRFIQSTAARAHDWSGYRNQ